MGDSRRARRKDDPELIRARERAALAEREIIRLRKLQSVTEAALGTLTLDDLLNELLTRIRVALSTDTAAVLLLNDDATALVARAAKGLEEQVERGVTIPLGKGFAGRIAAERRPVMLDHVDHSNVLNPLLREKGVQSLLGVPLLVNGHVLGVLHVGTLTPRGFAAEDVELLQLVADRVALAIDHARLYEAERRSRQEAEAASRAKDDFIAVLSHELRNPLGAVMSSLGLLERIGVQNESAVKARAIIRRQARQLARLLDDLLDVARLNTGRITLTVRVLNLGSMVERHVEALRASGLLDQHDVIVEAHDVWVEGDAGRLEQVFDNLMLNALKFTRAGGSIRVRAQAVGGEAVLQVSDTGIGLEEELRPHLFDLFAQGRQGLDRREGGLGIGLAIVRRLVECHGGRVEARSDGPGRGSTFTVHLPRTTRAVQTPVAVECPLPSRTADRRARILLAEDNEDAREALRALLESAGHVIYVAKNGPATIDEVIRQQPDVVLIDIGLPGLDGYEVARRLRLLGGTMRLVALTGYGQPEDRRRSKEAGFDAHLVKPVDADELARVLHSDA